MFDYLKTLLDSDNLAPHGICLLWRPELIWTHVISDGLIGAAYFSIPLALAAFLAKRQDVAFSWMFWCFAAFIMACGTTHFFSIWTLWVPDYGTEAIIKAVTAAVSVTTAAALWPLLPRAIALPSPSQLRDVNERLRRNIAERDEALAALERETAERLRTEEMLRQAQKMEAVGQLTGGVAHDFNNLLTIIMANLERIERRLPEKGADIMRSLGAANLAAERAAAVTQQLLAFARKQPLQPVATDANALIAGMVDLLRRALGERINLRTNLATSLPLTLVDPNQLENALLNLVVNARDAMPTGGTLVLSTDRDAETDTIRIEVRDTGVGMREDVRERAFEPFFTTKPVGQGTGLGLSQVYGFVAQSKGEVRIDSAPGAGTSVRIQLPIAPKGTARERPETVEPLRLWQPGLGEAI
jgi:signal transduction histidine kinase